MSIETYERLVGKNELYLLLEESEKYIGKGEKAFKRCNFCFKKRDKT